MIKKIQTILKNHGVDVWLLVNAENKDPYYQKIISPNTVALSIALIEQNKTTVLVHTLDHDNLIALKSTMRIVKYSTQKSLNNLIIKILKEIDKLKIIALNYTTMNDIKVDVIGHGTYSYLTNIIQKGLPQSKYKIQFISSEKIIYTLLDRKDETDLHKLRIAAKRANQIILDAFAKIKAGMTEHDLVEIVHKITELKPSYFKKEGVIEETFAWDPGCPIVLTGPSFEKGGHTNSSNTTIEKGFTVYFDFGVKLTFADGSQWSSDLQRTGYVLRDGEKDPPKEIIDKFNTIIGAISEGVNKIKPGMKGYEIDQIVRGYLLEKGYPNYDHGTGHSIGERAHNPGTALTVKKSKMSNLEIQPNGVYTIEPRIPTYNGVSIEEMVVVYEDKPAETLCKRQLKPILIKS